MSDILPIIKQLDVVVHEVMIDPQLVLNDHEHYQRYIIEERVQEAMEKIKHSIKHNDPLPRAFIAVREDGSYWALDRQHHTEGAKRLGITSYPAWSFNSTGWEQEAALFERFQELQQA